MCFEEGFLSWVISDSVPSAGSMLFGFCYVKHFDAKQLATCRIEKIAGKRGQIILPLKSYNDTRGPCVPSLSGEQKTGQTG